MKNNSLAGMFSEKYFIECVKTTTHGNSYAQKKQTLIH